MDARVYPNHLYNSKPNACGDSGNNQSLCNDAYTNTICLAGPAAGTVL